MFLLKELASVYKCVERDSLRMDNKNGLIIYALELIVQEKARMMVCVCVCIWSALKIIPMGSARQRQVKKKKKI